jgi:HEAT repeat protein
LLGEVGGFSEVSPLARMLKDGDAEVRVCAAYALAELGREHAIPPLYHARNHEDPDTRMAVAEALDSLCRPERENRFLGQVGPGFAFFAEGALLGLLWMRSDTGKAIITALLRRDLSEYDRATRFELIKVLGAAQDTAANRLLRTALSDRNTFNRRLCFDLLISSDSTNRSVYLSAALQDPVPSVRRFGVDKLCWYSDSAGLSLATEALRDPAPDVRKAVPQVLVHRYPGEAGKLLDLALGRETDPDVLEAITTELGRLYSLSGDVELVPALLAATHHAQPRVRAAALGRLHYQRKTLDETLRERVVSMMADPDSSVRLTAVDVAPWPQTGDVCDALLARLSDGAVSVRLKAIDMLGRGRVKAVLDGLAGAKNDSCAEVRTAAIWALGQYEDSLPVGVFLDALADSATHVRWWAIEALGRSGSAVAVPSLCRMLEDPVPLVRANAAWSLGRLGDSSAIPALDCAARDSDSATAREAIAALGRLGASRELARLLADAVQSTRVDAGRALAAVSDSLAVATLRQTVRETRDHELVVASHPALVSDPAGIERVMVAALYERGTYEMANAFASSGSRRLRRAAAQWLRKHPGAAFGCGSDVCTLAPPWQLLRRRVPHGS